MNSKFLNFEESSSPSGKTKVVTIKSKTDNFILGQIKWFSNWRKYVFYPESDVLFDSDCLTDIIKKIDSLTQEREAN